MIKIIYHFLRGAFGQGVAIAEIVDLDVFDVVSILLVDFVIQTSSCGRRLGTAWSRTGAVSLQWKHQHRVQNAQWDGDGSLPL